MRALIGLTAAATAMITAAAAQAATLEIDHAAVRITVIPEARADVVVRQVRGSAKAPITISSRGADAVVTGQLEKRIRGCDNDDNRPSVRLSSFGRLHRDEMAEIVVRTPMDAKINIKGGVTVGSIGRSGSLELRKSGCSDITVANVAGRFMLRESGAGDMRIGTVGSGEVTISGAGDVDMAGAQRGLDLRVSGAADVSIGKVSGPLTARLSGVGDIDIKDGEVGAMSATISGLGEIDFGGRAQSLDASVSGFGEISVREVTGPVTRRVTGGGKVRVG